MRSYIILRLTICFLAVTTVVDAQSVITFEDAVKLAMKNSVLINQQQNNLSQSRAQMVYSVAGFAPTLSASAGATQVNGNFFNQNEGKVVNGLFDQISGSLNANINLFSGLNQVYRVKQASEQLDAQTYYVNRTKQDVINTISSQYLQVLLDIELLRIAKENFDTNSKQLEQIRELVRVGSKSPVDEYNQDSQTRAAEIRALQAEITLTNDKTLLTQTLLLDPTEPFEVAKPTWDINTIGADQPELQPLVETALKNRGDYMRAIKNEKASQYSMISTRGNLMPSLYGFWSMNSYYNKLHGDPNVTPFESQIKSENLRKTYGLQLNIPILGGQQVFQNRYNYIQQKVLYLNNQITRKNIEIQVKSDVLRAHSNFELYKRTYASSVAQLEAAKMAFGLETERYNLGVTNFVEFSQANKTYVQAQTDMAQAEYRFLFQKVLLEYAVGTLKVEDIE